MENLINGLTATQKLDKAKIQLMMKASVFLSSLTFSLKHRLGNSAIGTAHTDGKEVVYQEEFINGLTVEETTGLIAHEVWHVAFNHITRRGDKEGKYYFAAADYVINVMLVDAGFELPKGGLLDYRFRGLSTEEVYEILKKENANVPEEPMEHILEPTEDGDEEGTSAGVEDHIRDILIRATNQALIADTEAYGSIPGEILRELKRMTDPVVPWQQLLMEFCTSKSKDDYSMRRPNRRLYPTYYLPSCYSEALENITVAIDTSGSMEDEILSQILAEIKFIHETLKPQSMTIIDCDNRIHSIYEIDEFTDIETLDFTGGGGTSFVPVVDFCKENEPTLLVYFTDLFASQLQEEQSYPILWICYSDHEEAPIGQTIYTKYGT
jgi:predicted metal-dependent peptidase